MLMLVHFISFEVLIHLGKMHTQIRTAPRAGNSGFGINNNALRFNPARFNSRDQAKQRRGGITAGIGDKIDTSRTFTVHLA
ncbi:hypothetical protein D3C73_1400880 [compost metagenome]